MDKQKTKRKKSDIEGLAIPAGLFVGMGIGFLVDSLVAWMFIGLGAGFAFMILARLVKKIISKRAKKNLLSLREQIEDILRKSAVRTKTGTSTTIKVDDTLVYAFSREKRGRKKKKKKKKVKKK